MLGAFIAVVETCGDIGVLSPFSARKSCCGSSYHINLEVDHSIPYGSTEMPAEYVCHPYNILLWSWF